MSLYGYLNHRPNHERRHSAIRDPPVPRNKRRDGIEKRVRQDVFTVLVVDNLRTHSLTYSLTYLIVSILGKGPDKLEV